MLNANHQQEVVYCLSDCAVSVTLSDLHVLQALSNVLSLIVVQPLRRLQLT